MEYISFKEYLPKLYKVLPGLIKSQYYCITGYTGSAKSFFTTFLFLLLPFLHCRKYNIPLLIIYVALEESTEKFWIRITSELLRDKYGLNLTYYQYMGYHEGMTEAHRKALKELEPEVAEMKKIIHVIADIKNPTGIRKKFEELVKPLGKRIDGEEFTDSEGNKHLGWTWKYHDPRQQVIIVADHVSLLSPEKNQGKVLSVHEAMAKYSEYCMDIFIKKYNAICCNVQQQQMSGDGLQAEKQNSLEPALSKLANNVELARDYTVVLSLFDPTRYGQKIYNGIDLTKYKGFRSLQILKHRDGEDNGRFALQFKGTPKFFEIPI